MDKILIYYFKKHPPTHTYTTRMDCWLLRMAIL